MNKLLRYVSVWYMLVASVATVQAQGYKTYADNFDNNKKNWFIKDTKSWAYSLKDGYYFIHSKKDKSFGFDGKSFYINPSKNFEIETSVTEVAGAPKDGSGLFWGASGRRSLYRFVVASNGYFTIGRYKRKKYKSIVKWTKSDVVKGLGEANVLKIAKNNTGVKFYINQKLVHTFSLKKFMFEYPFMGNYVGLIAFGQKQAKFDYFKLIRAKYKINLIPNPKQGYKKVPLGDGVNSEYNDILPKISPDGKTLYFIRKTHPDNIKSGKQDIWYSNLQKDGTWSQAKNIGKPINNSAHNALVAALPDGNTLIVADVYNADGSFKKNGLSITHRTKDGWELPKEIKIKNFYNKNYFIARGMSSDRQKLILALERDDSRGGLDLYISFWQEDKQIWTEPKNMGDDLNTYGNEGEPFLAADNKTLYFSTNGLPGYGGSDIYVTRRLDDTWTRWSTPQNLGPEVNSRRTDNSYAISAKGDYAYMLSYRNKTYRNDIFRIKLHDGAKPNPVVIVQGKVLNRKTGKPLAARIAYSDLNTGKLAGVARSNPRDGSYKIVLPYDKVYDFLASKPGFYSVSNHLDLAQVSNYKVVNRNLYLAPISVGQKIRLNNLFFDTGKSDLKPTSFGELARLIKSLKTYPNMVIEISGHTDSQGNAAKNLKLSRSRANAVLSYLKGKGVPTSRMKAKGYGQTKPVANNNTAKGRARNRRVEFVILKK